MAGVRGLLDKPWGKWLGISFAIIAIVVAGYFIKNSLYSATVRDERTRPFIDSVTMQPFTHVLEKGESIPVDAPSGGKTGYPGELCYWSKDGGTKTDPTVVLLNSWVHKPGPTFCPDCGRLVVALNPAPNPNRPPPPTKEEYEKRYGSQTTGSAPRASN
jgi:hypothetical protein